MKGKERDGRWNTFRSELLATFIRFRSEEIEEGKHYCAKGNSTYKVPKSIPPDSRCRGSESKSFLFYFFLLLTLFLKHTLSVGAFFFLENTNLNLSGQINYFDFSKMNKNWVKFRSLYIWIFCIVNRVVLRKERDRTKVSIT